MDMEILALCPFGIDEGVVSKAAELCPGRMRALVPEGEEARAAACGAAAVCALRSGDIFDEAAFADCLTEKISGWGSRIVLAPATVRMRNLMPVLAWNLGAGLTADCTALELQGGRLIQTRPAFGNAMAARIVSRSEIQMATLRPGVFRPEERPAVRTEIECMEYRETGGAIRCLSSAESAQGAALSQARIIVSGGMGVGSREGFQKLERLAARLGAGLGASRAAVDAGFAPYRCQVGMTGVTVQPKLYIAVGISGAVHHLAGMTGAEKVVAVNADPKAPIFDYADYGIVGHWETVVDKLMEEDLYEL